MADTTPTTWAALGDVFSLMVNDDGSCGLCGADSGEHLKHAPGLHEEWCPFRKHADLFAIARSPAAAGNPLPPDCPVVPLGTRDFTFYYQTPGGQVMSLLAGEHSRSNILALFGAEIPWLYRAFPRDGRSGVSWRPEDASEALMQAAFAKGGYTPAQTALVDDTDAAVLSFLLYVGRANCASEQYADILMRIHRGDERPHDHDILADAGLAYGRRLDGPGPATYIAIARNHRAIANCFDGTPWAGNPTPRIARVAGAIDHVMILMGGAHVRCVLIPMDTVLALMPDMVPW